MSSTKPEQQRGLRSWALTALLLGVAGCGSNSGPAAGGGELADADCAGSAAGDFAAQSLPAQVVPRPGPPILYAPPPRAAQLENTGIWQAQPILISGTSAYRCGEFLYQDWIYDDQGADGDVDDPESPREGETFSGPTGTYTYPADRDVYKDNAADFVELRVKPGDGFTAFRVTVNSLTDPERVGFTLAIGDSGTPQAWPHGANVVSPAELFLTVHGRSAELVDAATGETVSPAPSVAVDLERRQFELRVDHRAWNPGEDQVRLAAAIGLWDLAGDGYLIPGFSRTASQPGGAGTLQSPPAFFNVAFRFDEPLGESTQHSWRERAQSETLASGDLSRFHAIVDFAKLVRGETDELTGQPQGVPASGPLNRIFASRFAPDQGVDFAAACGEAQGCEGVLRGQLQPYAIYLPETAPPPVGYGLTLQLHSLSAAYNQYTGTRNQSQFGERGQGHIVITPAGRGPDGWYVDLAAADTFEVWADVARHYPLDPARVAISGYSMGGYGTFRFATRYPDLFVKAFTTVGPPGLGIWLPPSEPTGGESTNSFHLLDSVRHIPFMMWVMSTDELVPYSGTRMQATGFDERGLRYEFWTFTTGEHVTLAIHDQYAPAAEFLADPVIDRDPARVSYVLNPAMDFPERGIVGDRAYWLSGLTLRDDSGAAPRGRIDVFSHGFGVGDPPADDTGSDAGLLTGGDLPALAYAREWRRWGEAPSQPIANRLDITATNIATVTVHVERARVGCGAEINIDSDGPLEVQLAGCDRRPQ